MTSNSQWRVAHHRKFSVSRLYTIKLQRLDCTILMNAFLRSALLKRVARYHQFMVAQICPRVMHFSLTRPDRAKR